MLNQRRSNDPVIVINRGSDLTFETVWTDAAGEPLDLAGAAVAVYEPHTAISGRITLAISDATGGVISGRVEWADAMPLGRIMSFRLRLTRDGNDTSTPRIWIDVK